MNMLYYTEINAVCLIVTLLVRLNRYNLHTDSLSVRFEHTIMALLMVFCAADLGSWALNGINTFWGRLFLYLFDMAYFISSVLITFFWINYVNLETGADAAQIRRGLVYSSFPVILFSLLVLTTPWTHCIFYADDAGFYHRGWLIAAHWFLAFSYMLASIVLALHRASKTASASSRSDAFRLCFFCFFPLIGAILQILIYGSTFIQAGFVLSVVLSFSRSQNALISTDALTGVSNRAQLDRYLNEKFMNSNSEETIFLVMLDINDFKSINDTYGHLSGDQALKLVASALESVCTRVQRGTFLARYGGDEFVICGMVKAGLNAESVKTQIAPALDETNSGSSLPYSLSVSIGSYEGSITNLTPSELLRRADAAMYSDKKKFKEKTLSSGMEGSSTGKEI